MTIHADKTIKITSVRTKQMIFEKELPFKPRSIVLSPDLNDLYITLETCENDVDQIDELKENYSDFEWRAVTRKGIAYMKIHLRLKDNLTFNMNDAFIEAYKVLPATIDYKKYRSDLDKRMVDEVDLVNNINILSVIAVDQQYQSQVVVKNFEQALEKKAAHLIYDSTGKTPFCRSLDLSNVLIMKSLVKYMKYEKEHKQRNSMIISGVDKPDQMISTLFSNALLGQIMKTDVSWALKNLDDTLFQSNSVRKQNNVIHG